MKSRSYTEDEKVNATIALQHGWDDIRFIECWDDTLHRYVIVLAGYDGKRQGYKPIPNYIEDSEAVSHIIKKLTTVQKLKLIIELFDILRVSGTTFEGINRDITLLTVSNKERAYALATVLAQEAKH